MALTATFDALSFVKQLKAAGLSEDQAEIQAKAINSVLLEFQNKRLNELATKQDITSEIARAKVEIIKWVAGMLVTQAAIVATLVKLL